MDKIKNFLSALLSIFILLSPFLLGLLFPKTVLISLGILHLIGFFKVGGSGVGPALVAGTVGLLGILGVIGGAIGLLISISA